MDSFFSFKDFAYGAGGSHFEIAVLILLTMIPLTLFALLAGSYWVRACCPRCAHWSGMVSSCTSCGLSFDIPKNEVALMYLIQTALAELSFSLYFSVRQREGHIFAGFVSLILFATLSVITVNLFFPSPVIRKSFAIFAISTILLGTILTLYYPYIL